MTRPSASRRQRQRGTTMVMLLIVLTGLATIAGLTTLSVQGGIQAGTADRFQASARYAAESGGSAAMVYLRTIVNPSSGFTAYVTPNNATPVSPAGIPGNNVPAGQPGNLMSGDMASSYSVMLLNNRNDPGFAAGVDTDTIVIIRSTGYGPGAAVAVIESEVYLDKTAPATPFTLLGWRQLF